MRISDLSSDVGLPILLGHVVEEHTLCRQLIKDGLFALSIIPGIVESVKRGVLLVRGFAAVVPQRFGDEAAAAVELLDALDDDADWDVIDEIGRASCRERVCQYV